MNVLLTFDFVADVSHVFEEGADFVIDYFGVSLDLNFALDFADLVLEQSQG